MLSLICVVLVSCSLLETGHCYLGVQHAGDTDFLLLQQRKNGSDALAKVTFRGHPDHSLRLQLGSWKNLTLNLSSALPFSVELQFGVAKAKEIARFVPRSALVHIPRNSTSAVLRIKAEGAIHNDVLKVDNCSEIHENGTTACHKDVDYSDAFIRLQFVHSESLAVVCIVVGWIYFAAWSVSFYPQIYENWKRKSVVGLNFDFLALNLTGFICYSVYNCLLFWSYRVQNQYRDQLGPYAQNPVFINDIAFAVHAVFATTLTIFQCFIYERGSQKISKICWCLLGIFWLFGLISVILGGTKVINWYRFALFLSYIKLGVTIIKYIPQAYFNFRRKSTVGWSIGNVLLDFTGGCMSILQMVLESYNEDDWTGFFGDPTKFGLGLLSIFFDILFIIQHYVLYRGATAPYECLNEESKKIDPEADSYDDPYNVLPDDNATEVQNAAEDDRLLG